jgi:putative ABC transport system substrate-binding protein
MRRREFITLVGGATAWPIVARAQQALPVVAYFRVGSLTPQLVEAFRQGLSSMGFQEGRNVTVDYGPVTGQYDRLRSIADDLVRRGFAVIYAGDNATAVAIKGASPTVPVVFRIGGDPVVLGLVASLSRPGGNLTGVSFLATATEAIRLQMLHQAVPDARVMGLLVNPANPNAAPDTAEAQKAARQLGLDLQVESASTSQEIDRAFAAFVKKGVRALSIDGDGLFNNRRLQLAILTARHGMPAIYNTRDLTDAGLLMSYGASNVEADRLAGIYVGRILKGEKPADLPVQQSVKVELIINLITARALGIAMPPTLLARADEVIE